MGGLIGAISAMSWYWMHPVPRPYQVIGDWLMPGLEIGLYCGICWAFLAAVAWFISALPADNTPVEPSISGPLAASE
jgi:hypothetical protein